MNTAAWQPPRGVRGDGKCVIKSETKAGDAAMMRMADHQQSRSGCSFPKAPARRRARPSPFWGCRAITSRSAIPRLGAWRGSRASSGNFIAVRGCATIRPGSWPLSRSCWRSGVSTCCCRPMSRDFCLRGCSERLEGRVGLALPGFESYRTAHSKAGFSRLLDRLGLPQPPTRIVKSGRRTARRRSLSVRHQDLGRHRQPRHLVCAQRGRSRKRAARTRRRATRSPTRCWCRI